MNHKEVESRVSQLLKANSAYSVAWGQPFEVTHIPFMGTRQKFFLLVSTVLSSLVEERKQLVSHCLSICRSIIGSGLLIEEKGLEVAIYANAKKAHRIIRFSVFDGAFSKIEGLNLEEIIEGRYPGIVYQFPSTKESALL